MNAVAEAESSAPSPSTAAVRQVASPGLVPATTAKAVRRPRVTAYNITSTMTGPGAAAMAV